jgi:hypothetical protein
MDSRDSAPNTDTETDRDTTTTTAEPAPETTDARSTATTIASTTTFRPTAATETVAANEGSTSKLAPADGEAGEQFGRSIAIQDDTALVGAPHDDVSGRSESGAVYWYERSGATWEARGKITSGEYEATDQFGWAVDIAGDWAFIGAIGHKGAVFVFTREDGGWRQQRKLTASDGNLGDNFGKALALDTDRAIIGAPQDADPFGTNGGAVYVFEKISGQWAEAGKLLPSEGNQRDLFGKSVAISGDVALVGAYGNEAGHDGNGGAAYVFRFETGTWEEIARIRPEAIASVDNFGRAVTVEDDRALISGLVEDDEGNRRDAAFIFERSGEGWRETAQLTPPTEDTTGDPGKSVALDGDRALLGAYMNDTAKGDRSGSTYVFERENGIWQRRASLVPADGDRGDYFGRALAAENGTAIVGAPLDEDPNGDEGGSAYVFNL